MMDLRKLTSLAMMCLLMVCIPSFAQEKPSLQTLFNESSRVAKVKANAADDVIVVDLNEWQNEYDVTLNIATGKKYMFTNGELKWIGGEAPLITISGNSTVEFADGVYIYSGTSCYSPLILLKGGAKVIVDGARVRASKKPIPPGVMTGNFSLVDAIQIDPNTTLNQITQYSGNIEGTITNESRDPHNMITLRGGSVSGVKCETDLYASGELYIYDMALNHFIPKYYGLDLGKYGVVHIDSEIKKPGVWELGYSSFLSNLSIDSENCKNRVIARSWGSRKITKDDLEKISVKGLDTEKYELVLEDEDDYKNRNQVIIREKNITGQQWLQEQINSYVNITTDTDEQPGIITIPEEGIELTDLLMVPKGAFVKLVGGPITISKDFKQGPDMAVSISAGAHLFIDNTWDFNALPLHAYAWIFANNGHLSFGKNSTLLNTWSEVKRNNAFIHNNGRFDFDNPDSNVYENTIKIRIKGVFVDGEGDVFVKDGTVFSWSEAIIAKNCTMYNGSFFSSDTNESPRIKSDNFYMYGGTFSSYVVMDVDYAEITAGIFKCANIFKACKSIANTITIKGDISGNSITFKDNDQEHCLNLTSSLTSVMPISANWSRIDFSKPYVIVRGKDYQLTKDDLGKCDFVDLPSGVRAKLDGNTIVLTKQKKDLHDLFDEVDANGTEDNPTDLMGDMDEVDSEEPEDMKDDLHILFGDPEDKEDGNESTKAFMLHFDGDYGIRIPATSSIEFKNINIDLGENGLNSFIEVYGKLIINVNVYIRNVCTCTKQVIYVRPGGTLIWRGGINSIPGIVIYNDGGTVIYEGGDTYGTTYGIHNVNGGKVIIKGGSIGGGEYAVYNPSDGEIDILDGSTINGDIYSNGTITTEGNTGISNITMPWNCHINLTSSITTDWFINITNIQNINVPAAFIHGTNGYKLTEEDLKRIKTNLPETYCLILDINLNIIFIADCNSTGIEDNIINSKNSTETIYSIDGKRNDNRSGIKIVRYSDGKVHKVLNK